MVISQKCQYALRAIFKLAEEHDNGPVKIAEIARSQAIPQRFLEVILLQLKQGGFVDSQRGKVGGYFLIQSPEELAVGQIIRFIQGPIAPVSCVMSKSKSIKCNLYKGCVFLPMWEKVQKAISDVYDNTTFKDLINTHQEMVG